MSESREDALLFTPGPLTTSRTVEEAMLAEGAAALHGNGAVGRLVHAAKGEQALPHGCHLGHERAVARAEVVLEVVQLDSPEAAPVDPAPLEAALRAQPALTHVAVVHCETSTGLVNPVEAIGAITPTSRKAGTPVPGRLALVARATSSALPRRR